MEANPSSTDILIFGWSENSVDFNVADTLKLPGKQDFAYSIINYTARSALCDIVASGQRCLI